ncbi:unnamed protein product [Didymodactylos carnosus]|uniref:Uncharacterized protein n=1 Tax=Didymodactylos carnosus TaxID=1234261 RepID=A0A815GF33_9BILA|nr:unnamed protein product [Didymodactylos carnosus]CAF4196013.1 unnamed protein product [Didymodactylos carnosus]
MGPRRGLELSENDTSDPRYKLSRGIDFEPFSPSRERGLGSPEHLDSTARNFSPGFAAYLKFEGSKSTPLQSLYRASEPSARVYFRVLAAPRERPFPSARPKEDLDQQAVSQSVMAEYDDALTILRNKLMALEVTLVDQLEETIQTFERNLSEMVSNFTESMRSNFSQLRELQAWYNETMMNLCISTVDRLMKGELEDEFPDETRELFADKDTITNACQSSDEVHRTKIDQREDEMFSRISNWQSTMIDNIHEDEEYKRNRKRIIEISRLIDYLRADIEDT